MSDTTGLLNLDGFMSQGIHKRALRIYFEDTDFSGLVYHANYLRFLERGRSDFMRHLKISHKELMEDGMAFCVHRMNIRFLKAAHIDDILHITTRIKGYTAARILFKQTASRGHDMLIEAEVSVVLIKSGRPQRLAAPMLETLKAVHSASEAMR